MNTAAEYQEHINELLKLKSDLQKKLAKLVEIIIQTKNNY